MQIQWNDKEPIYHQLRDWLVRLILDGAYAGGDALPSVRQIASEHRINPITVSKAMQLLVDEGVIEKRRGMGMFVMADGRERLVKAERERFIREEWPHFMRRIERLGLNPRDLVSEWEKRT